MFFCWMYEKKNTQSGSKFRLGCTGAILAWKESFQHGEQGFRFKAELQHWSRGDLFRFDLVSVAMDVQKIYVARAAVKSEIELIGRKILKTIRVPVVDGSFCGDVVASKWKKFDCFETNLKLHFISSTFTQIPIINIKIFQ